MGSNGMWVDLSKPLSDTPNISDIETLLVKRAMVVFFLVDVSGSMRGDRINAVNSSIRKLIPELAKREQKNTSAEVKIAIMEYSDNVVWLTRQPQPVKNYAYRDIVIDEFKVTNMGLAFEELNAKLSRKEFLNSAAGAYTPLIILLTDGIPTDPARYPAALEKLKNNQWFRYATKAGIAIQIQNNQKEKAMHVLTSFTGRESMVFEAKNIEILARQIELVTLTGVDFVTQQGSLQNTKIQNVIQSNYPKKPQTLQIFQQNEPKHPFGMIENKPDEALGINPEITALKDVDWERDLMGE